MKDQDKVFKEKLGDMKQASMLLGAAATNLEQVQAQEEQMVESRMELLQERRELSEKMKIDMRRTLDLSLESTKEELAERAMLYYRYADQDGDGMAIDSQGWRDLQALLEKNNVHMDENVAGEDGVLQVDEFIVFIDNCLDAHFSKLKKAALEVLLRRVPRKRP